MLLIYFKEKTYLRIFLHFIFRNKFTDVIKLYISVIKNPTSMQTPDILSVNIELYSQQHCFYISPYFLHLATSILCKSYLFILNDKLLIAFHRGRVLLKFCLWTISKWKLTFLVFGEFNLLRGFYLLYRILLPVFS